MNDILPGPVGSNVSSILAADAARVVVAGLPWPVQHEFWQSNGTAAGSVIVDDIAPGPNSSNPTALVWSPALWRVFFQADDGKSGVELRTNSLPSLGPCVQPTEARIAQGKVPRPASHASTIVAPL